MTGYQLILQTVYKVLRLKQVCHYDVAVAHDFTPHLFDADIDLVLVPIDLILHESPQHTPNA